MKKMHSLKEIELEVHRLAELIDAPKEYLPTFGSSEDGARPHIELDHGIYHYVIVERGKELERHMAPNSDELLYLIFKDVTFQMAGKYELQNRRLDEDVRRQLFEYQEHLIGKIESRYSDRLKLEHQQLLKWSPFNEKK